MAILASPYFYREPERASLTDDDAGMLSELLARLSRRGMDAPELLAQCREGGQRHSAGGEAPAECVDASTLAAFAKRLGYHAPVGHFARFLARARAAMVGAPSERRGRSKDVVAPRPSSRGSIASWGGSKPGSAACSGTIDCTLPTQDFLALLDITAGRAAGGSQPGSRGSERSATGRIYPAPSSVSSESPREGGSTARLSERKRRRFRRRLQPLSEEEEALAARLPSLLFGPGSTTESVFKTLDRNGDGFCSCEDFLVALERAGIAICDDVGEGVPASALSGAEVAEVLSAFDRNGDGLLTYDEFLVFLRHAGHGIAECAGAVVGTSSGSTSESTVADTRASSNSSASYTSADACTASSLRMLPDFEVLPGRQRSRRTSMPNHGGSEFSARPSSQPVGRVARSASLPSIFLDNGFLKQPRHYLPPTYSGEPRDACEFLRTSIPVSRRGRALGDAERVKKAFEKWDRNGDGYLSPNELFQVLNFLDGRFTRQAVSRIFEDADTNKDGRITHDELISWLFTPDDHNFRRAASKA